MERSISGFILSYLGCPVMCESQLQTEKPLRYTYSEYIVLSQPLSKTITIIDILK